MRAMDLGLVILNWIYPLRCSGCEKDLPYHAGDQICKACIDSIPEISSPFCPRCGAELPIDSAACISCAGIQFSFECSRSCSKYGGTLKNLHRRLKYGGKEDLGRELAKLMRIAWNRYAEIQSAEIVVPVPSHPARFRERGFNQAETLAREFVRGVPASNHLTFANALIRVRKTTSQTALTGRERMENVQEAFKVKNISLILNKEVLLIDDVFTTGATLDACSRALLSAGAGKVFCLTLARN